MSVGRFLAVFAVLAAGASAGPCDDVSFTDNQCVGGNHLFEGQAPAGYSVYRWEAANTHLVSVNSPNAQSTFFQYTRAADSCADYDIDITLAMTDGAGVTVNCALTFSASDNAAPTIQWSSGSAPTDSVEHIQEYLNEGELPTQTANDACDGNSLSVTFTEHKSEVMHDANNAAKGLFSMERTWYVADKCGNANSHTAHVDVIDEEAPTFTTSPVDESTPCESYSSQAGCTIEATDNSQLDVVVTATSDVVLGGGCANDFKRVQTWTATDIVGNSASHSRTITVFDKEAPVLGNLPAQSQTVDCHLIPSPAAVTISDNCDDLAKLTYAQNNDGDNIVRSWSGADACGNTHSFESTIVVQDLTPPTLVIESDTTMDCLGRPPVPCVATVSDNCDEDVSITLAEFKDQGSCPNEYDLIHTYTAVDDKGNQATESRTVTVSDNTAPVINFAPALSAAVTVDCTYDDKPTYIASASDACEGSIDVEYAESKLSGNDYNFVMERTWTATDACGHGDQEVQTVTVVDTTPPVWTHTSAIDGSETNSQSCRIARPTRSATATDACCDVTVVSEESTSAGRCDNEWTLTTKFTATDCAGNVNTFTYIDHITSTLPDFVHSMESSSSVQWQYDMGTSLDPPTVTLDHYLCAPVVIVPTTETVAGSCSHEWDVVHTYSISDGNCDNTDSVKTTISVIDTTPPIINAVDDRTNDCVWSAGVWGATAYEPEGATGNSVSVSTDCADSITSCDHAGSVTCTFTASDVCGNVATSTATETFSDTENPSLICNLLGSSASDNCDTFSADDIVKQEWTTGGDGCEIMYYEHTTHDVTDACGNKASQCPWKIAVLDTAEPAFDASEIAHVQDTMLACLSDTYPSQVDLSATDNFSTATVTKLNTLVMSISCGSVREYKWTAQDCAGNNVNHTQTITVAEDSNLASFDQYPAHTTIECPDTPQFPQLVVTYANGACDSNSYTVSGTTAASFSLDASAVAHVHTWQWQDAAGCQSLSHTQTIVVKDSNPPMLDFPNRETTCSHTQVDPTVYASDLCDGTIPAGQCSLDSSTYQAVFDDQSCYSFEETWTCTDKAGLTTSAVQTYLVTDDTNPTFSSHPADVTEECAYSTCPDLNANDNCNAEAQAVSCTTSGSVTNNTGSITDSWTFTDDCGLTVSHSREVTVVDSHDPVLACDSTGDSTTDCASKPNQGSCTVSDTCDTGVTISFSSSSTGGSCADAATEYYEWTACDVSGRCSTETQTITYNDVVLPTLTIDSGAAALVATPAEHTVEWDADWTTFNPVDQFQADAEDNCGNVFAACTAVTQAISSCHNRHVYSCTLTDDCENVATFSNIVQIDEYDNRIPSLSEKPSDLALMCHEPVPTKPIITSPVGAVVSPADIWTGEGEGCKTMTRSWSVSHCGNTDNHIQTFTFVDKGAPLITVPTYSDDNCTKPAWGAVSALDSCDTTPDLVQTETNTTVTGGHTFVRVVDASDDCGNLQRKTQTFTIADTTDPVFNEVLDSSMSAVTIEQPHANPLPDISAHDNCDGDMTPELDTVSIQGSCPSEWTLTRTWTATDTVGNYVQQTQTVTSQDTQAPVFDWAPSTGAPADLDIDFGDLDEHGAATPVAMDAVDGSVTVSFSEEESDHIGVHNFTLTRTWSAVDSCGNTASHVQTVIVRSAPACEPPDQEVSCENAATIKTAVWHASNCSTHLNDDVEIQTTVTTSAGSCDQEYTEYRLFKITDTYHSTEDHVVSVDVTQTIHYYDTSAPVFADPSTSGEQSITGHNCHVIAPPSKVANDNCDTIAEIEPTLTSSPATTLGGQYVYTYTATDACGNTASTTHTLTVHDLRTAHWTVSSLPAASSNHECIAPTHQDQTPSCTGDCDLSCTVELVSEQVSEQSCPTNILRQWSATSNGKTIYTTASLEVYDNSPPTVTADADLSCTCNDPCVPGSSAFDSCDGSIGTTFNYTGDGVNRVYTHYATDACGNVGTDTQSWYFEPLTKPSIDQPSDYSCDCIDCNPYLSSPPWVTDDCDDLEATASIASTVSGLANCASTGVLQTLIRQFDATDSDGLVAEPVYQTVVIKDTAKPIFAGLPADNVHHQCNASHTVTTTDNCDLVTSAPIAPSKVDGADGWYTLTWESSDDCGNTVTESRQEKIQDTTPPVFDATWTEDVDLGCDEDVPPMPPAPSGMDNCDGPLVAVCEHDHTESDCGTQTYKYVCTLTDTAGLTTVQTKTYTKSAVNNNPLVCTDTTASDVDCAAGVAAHGAVCTDPCSGAEVPLLFVRSEVSTVGCVDSGLHYWATETDACGRKGEVTQNVKSTDSTPPVFATDTPGDETVACTFETPNMPTATDDCGEPTVQLDASGSVDNTWTDVGNGQFTQKWYFHYKATDECGLFAYHMRTVTVEDKSPVFNPASFDDVTVECNAGSTAAPPVDATDECSGNLDVTTDTSTTFTRTSIGDSNLMNTIVHTFSATGWAYGGTTAHDTVSVTAKIQVVDTTPPVLTGNFDTLVVSCASIPDTPTFGAYDTCTSNDDLQVNTVPTTSNTCGLTGTTVYTTTATDLAGNTASNSKTVIVVDSAAPSLTYNPTHSGEVTVECDDIDTWSVPTCSASDSCTSGDIVCSHEEITYTGEHSDFNRKLYKYTAADGCGNTVVEYLTVVIVDTGLPTTTLSGEPTSATECHLYDTVDVTAQHGDSCSTFTHSLQRTTAPGACAEEFTELYAWVVTDAHGNSKETNRTYTFVDTTGPTLIVGSVPDDETFECDSVAAAPTVRYTDNCAFSDEVVTHTSMSQSPVICAHGYTLNYEFAKADNCGNNGEMTTVRFTSVDTTPPVLHGVPEDVSLDAGAAFPAFPTVTATDNCADPSVVFVGDEYANANECVVAHYRTWSTSDECGNSATGSQTIVVTENTKPTFANIPADSTAEVGSTDYWPTAPTATDRQNGFLEVSGVEVDLPGTCLRELEKVITWTATDACMNTDFVRTTVTFQDTTPPTFGCTPSSVAVACDSAIPAAVTVTFTDSDFYGGDITYEPEAQVITLTPKSGTCDSHTFVRRYSATDCSGNTATHDQTVTVNDVTPPVFSRLPSDISVECGCDTVPSAMSLKALDDCDGTLTASVSEVRTDGEPLDSDKPGVIVRTYSVADACGNAASHAQSITIGDTQAPVMHFVPPDANVHCEDHTDVVPVVVASDDCDEHVTVATHSDATTAGNCDSEFTLTRTWSVSDESGNTADQDQVIQVVDHQAPSVLAGQSHVHTCLAPNPTGVYAADEISLFPLYDNCDDNAVVSIVSCNVTTSSDASCTADLDNGSVSITPGTEAGLVTVYAVLEDACGNSADVSHTFTLYTDVASAATAGCGFAEQPAE